MICPLDHYLGKRCFIMWSKTNPKVPVYCRHGKWNNNHCPSQLTLKEIKSKIQWIEINVREVFEQKL